MVALTERKRKDANMLAENEERAEWRVRGPEVGVVGVMRMLEARTVAIKMKEGESQCCNQGEGGRMRL